MSNWFTANWGITNLLRSIRNLLRPFVPVLAMTMTPLIVILTLGEQVIGAANALFGRLLIYLNELLANLQMDIPGVDLTSIATDLWAYANVFVPLDTLVTLLDLYTPIFVASVIIRMIKAFIPGL